MAPGEAASRPSPVADNYLKGEGGRERPKNPKAKRTESVAKRWEAESGRRGEEGARRQNEKFSDWQRRTGGSA